MKRRTFVTAASAVSVGALSGCAAPTEDEGTEAEEQNGGAEDEGTTTETTAEGTTTEQGGQDGGATQIRMETEGDHYYFDPIGLFVEPGATVEWVIESGSHSSTAYAEGNGGAEVNRIPQDAEPWNSEVLSDEGATFTHTFEATGTYDYFCVPHKSLGMVGRVVCGEPGGPAEGDMPPDGDVPESQTIVDQGEVSHGEFSG